MAEMLGLSHQQLKNTYSNMLRALIKKVDGMQEHLNHVNRELEIPRKNNKLVLGKKKNMYHVMEETE